MLLGLGCTDLAHAARHTRYVPGLCGAAAVLVVGLLAGLTGWPDLLVVLLVAGLAVLWERTVAYGFRAGRPWVPLVLLGVSVLGAVLWSGQADLAGGPFARWLQQVPVPVLGDLDPDRVLLLAGIALVQMSTGNVLVRLVLAVTGTIKPSRSSTPQDPDQQLKGGRLLGPLERLFILGLGLARNLTAAAIVVAAKGLLRFPELSSRSEQEQVHRLTEYFLVGSFVSWLVALSGLVLLG